MAIEKTCVSSRLIKLRSLLRFAALASAAIFTVAGCQKMVQTDDPQMKPIQQMLDEQLPLGSPQATVNAFLSARGYPSEPGEKQGTIVATIRHIDTQRLQPVTARVTFYFDESGKLKNYELQRTRNEPIPK